MSLYRLNVFSLQRGLLKIENNGMMKFSYKKMMKISFNYGLTKNLNNLSKGGVGFRELYDANPLQKQFSDILFDRADEPATASSWNTFDEKDSLLEDELIRGYYKLANANKNTSVKTVLDQAEKDVKTKDPRLVHQVLMRFARTYTDAKQLRLRVPPLILRAPKSTKPKQRPILSPGPMIGVPGKTPENKEDLLEYWREDPNLNEHHEKWHLVYGKNRVDDPNNVGDEKKYLWKDRQGELFIYMHRQIMARYFAERLSVGLPDVKTLDNYSEEIPEGYDASDVAGFESRPAGLKLRDIPDFSTVQNLADARDRLIKTIDQGYFDDVSNSKSIKTEGSIESLDLLGIAIEAGITETTYKNYDAALWGTNYVAFHNNGHIMISLIKEGQNRGVMGDNKTACRDPVFYRWHRYVDDLFVRYQSKLPPNNYNDVPEVHISNQDVALVFKDKIEAIKELTKRTDIEPKVQEWGESHIDDIFKHNISTLETKLKTRSLQLEGDDQPTEIQYLFPREWYYFFRVKNPTKKEANVTFRVFIVPTQFEHQFNRYIEVDKFQRTIKANSETLITRDCDRSSVVSQPPKKTPEELDDNAAIDDEDDTDEDVDYSDYCECGWPFHLVLPRGNSDGLPFKLVVFLSSGELDKIESVRKCGSLSFCGSQQLAGKYPDSKEMGYPFNRPLTNGNLKDTFGNMKNAAIKEIKVKFVSDFPEFTKA
ncbi:hypothetical protein Glove_185g48 [Diversispora epigaea]|uniref:Tyrosinase copper-binding domain-containing protein n=1 Tax=Diversispora epigaea TaxID=1348612 RepID=A0A397IMF4_9GLOM|nr:hypothetical protein Glove_185g48 [Diversispora epigaea]